MGGNGDGVPCESQWCTGASTRCRSLYRTGRPRCLVCCPAL